MILAFILFKIVHFIVDIDNITAANLMNIRQQANDVFHSLRLFVIFLLFDILLKLSFMIWYNHVDN